MRTCLLLLTTPFILAACEADADPAANGPATVIETIGDTTVVRTVSGSVWGAEATLVPEVSIGELDGPDEYLFGFITSIAADDDLRVYAFDFQAQHVQVYDSLGTYVATLGRPGEGPGEFNRAEAIAMLPDNRLVVRNPGNQRIEVFGPEAGQTEQWRYGAGGLHSVTPLYTDMHGRTLVNIVDRSGDPSSRVLVTQLLVLGPDGTPADTLAEPSSPSATRFGPFNPAFHWTVHSSGHFLTGLSSEYRIDLARDDGVLRIERAADPVPVLEEERAYARERFVRGMRQMDPDWSWDGPPIPSHKPFFSALLSGRDGRIWVRVATEGYPVENEDHDPENPSSVPVLWREPVRYDVFEPDGTYLGAVAPPDGFAFSNPFFDGDYVWGVTRDELGVARVVRFRIVVGGG
ncbi:MAG: 6-bladed beta-propeller [Gemmatimonadota bacterium]|nr:6-bladed beta-propeller [Gemmatimonadota bacterium]